MGMKSIIDYAPKDRLVLSTFIKKILDWLFPFFIALGVAVAAINIFPALSTWLPQLFGLA